MVRPERTRPERKVKDDAIIVQGTVLEVLPGGKYKIALRDMEQEIEGYAAGKMRKFRIRIIPGDIVDVELNPYEITKGRIVYREIDRQAGKKNR